MTRKTKKPKAKRTITLRVTGDEEERLKDLQRAYPDKPSLPETAHRVLEVELHRDKRGG